MLLTQIWISWLSPTAVDFLIQGNADQTVRAQMRPLFPGGIAGQAFTLTLKRAYDDAVPALLVAGAIDDPLNCVVSFVVGASAVRGLTGRYLADVRRTDAGNDGPLASGQARVIQAVGN